MTKNKIVWLDTLCIKIHKMWNKKYCKNQWIQWFEYLNKVIEYFSLLTNLYAKIAEKNISKI